MDSIIKLTTSTDPIDRTIAAAALRLWMQREARRQTRQEAIKI
jgi:hypothetical protein